MKATGVMERTVTDEMLAGLRPGRRPRVIVVEDDPEMRAWVEEILQESGFEVRAAGDSLSALVLHMRQSADLVITDWKMPDMDGLKLIESLRRCSPDLPVIMVTAYPDEDLVRLVQDEGVFSCLAKPFREAQLLAHAQGALLCSRLPRSSRGIAAPGWPDREDDDPA
jgi:two-component system OmpR family response regulator